jgi:uncharacterized protein (TIGR00266 family)
MRTEVIGHNAFQSVRVELGAGESFVSEAGKMVRMSSCITSEVKSVAKSGGMMAGLKRMLGGESFFFSHYTASAPGEVVLAPTLPGNVGFQQLDGRTGWYCAGGSYLASGPEIKTEPKWQGMKGLFSGESLVFVHATGIGPLILDAFGMVREEQVSGSFTVDTGHVVAFEDTLQYTISKAGGSWLTSFLAGEGFVIRFSGQGKVLVQSHNMKEFGSVLGPKLPPR